MFERDVQKSQTVIGNYFEGIYHGDINMLESAFHRHFLLVGDNNGQPYFKRVQEYLNGVKTRKGPSESGEEFLIKILGTEMLDDIACAKLHLPMLGYNYYDYMSLSRINGK